MYMLVISIHRLRLTVVRVDTTYFSSEHWPGSSDTNLEKERNKDIVSERKFVTQKDPNVLFLKSDKKNSLFGAMPHAVEWLASVMVRW